MTTKILGFELLNAHGDLYTVHLLKVAGTYLVRTQAPWTKEWHFNTFTEAVDRYNYECTTALESVTPPKG